MKVFFGEIKRLNILIRHEQIKKNKNKFNNRTIPEIKKSGK